MCGRFVFFADNDEERINLLIEKNLPGIKGLNKLNPKRGDVYPSQTFPVICQTKGEPVFKEMKWGYPPVSKESKNLLINARAETADQKYTFKHDFMSRRCIIPATGFYEWSKEKEKCLFTDNEGLLFIGGLYTHPRDQRNKEALDDFVILTKSPDQIVKRVHNRMPVLIPLNLAHNWLTDTKSVKSIINNYSIHLKDDYNQQLSMF